MLEIMLVVPAPPGKANKMSPALAICSLRMGPAALPCSFQFAGNCCKPKLFSLAQRSPKLSAPEAAPEIIFTFVPGFSVALKLSNLVFTFL